MKKDPNRYTPRPYGHAAPWNRQPAPDLMPARTRAAATVTSRWPWVVLAALVVAALGWLVYDTAVG